MNRLVTALLSLVAVASFGQSSYGVRLFGFQSSSLSDAQMLYQNSAWP
ncbi:MAG: hypothetical protein ACKOC0_00880 [Cytophagales bacterium]